jgi:DEAD/DEAH box helicase domain-containing protein
MNSLQNLLSSWRSDPAVGGNVEAWKNIPARPARFEPLPINLHPALIEALGAVGIQALYSHQSAAWQHIQKGAHVVIVTGTASGKTLSYNLPVLDYLLRDSEARALYIFPTKALAHDQLSTLRNFARGDDSVFPPSMFQAYDGDTPSSARPSIRSKARLVITNPDMLHTGILPHHTAWDQFFRQLKFIVIDEMHVYRGVFGSHVANVLRRLKRIARFYGSSPQFILTSATIANPTSLAMQLIESNVDTVEQDGSAHGPKSFLIYNPPIVDRDLGLRRSSLQESVRLAEDLLAYDVQTIIFGRSRRTVELILTYLRQRSTSPLPSTIDAKSQEAGVETFIRGYRSGYLPAQRRSIEQGLRQGSVRTVVATNALELGIDVGGLDAALLVGYPGTIAASWQQAGRAGRGAETSLAVLIATADPLDQFLASHPDYFFERSPEQALINPDNLLILLNHLSCAAFELPFQAGESFGGVDSHHVGEFLEFLKNEGVLHQSGGKYFWMADQYPAQEISLRSASANNVILQVNEDDIPVTIGQIDQASAYWMTHPQAIYLHEGRTYMVDELDLEGNIAWLRQVDTDYYTEPRRETTVQLLEKLDENTTSRDVKAYGEISVTTQVTGFRKIRWYTHEQIGIGELDLPKTELQTTGYWLALTEDTVEHLRQEGLWTNDPNNYGPNWRQQRDLARARDEYRCQVCGAPEQGRSHAVHHKIPFRTFPSYEQANRLENLVTLCPACHRRVETAVRVRSGLSGLAYALGHLAPLFLMCDVGDLGIHSDPQSNLSEGMPTVIIYDLVPAGIGFSQRLFELHGELIRQARELVASCECIDGCPSCVGPGGENGTGGKRETLAILEALV